MCYVKPLRGPLLSMTKHLIKMKFVNIVIIALFLYHVRSVRVRVHLNEVQCARACTMLELGRTQHEVAREMGVSSHCIQNV